ncbi:MAG TPA: short-chain fatty acyl-CoA regulator family protein [Anaeromyxobacteraceae bacterium]|nr:short-chain fatty acyl-CoA regulator family protein [Anaeromyxobacteraceae bacterium]
MPDAPRLGGKLRAMRRREGFTQTELAQRLGVSPSYLNLIEHDKRPLTAQLLIRLSETFHLDLKHFSSDADARVAADLLEVFGDPLFEPHDLQAAEVRELAGSSLALARAVVALYGAYRRAREAADTLTSRLSQDGPSAIDSRLPTEEVADLIQRNMNFFPELEDGAAEIWRETSLNATNLYDDLVLYLERAHRVRVQVERAAAMGGALRRYDPERKILALSEVLRRGSRNFQLAFQVGLLTQGPAIDKYARDPLLTSGESRALARVALANYFAAAVLMPYEPFVESARLERYDLELLGHRFRASFEQVAHRLTTLRRPGAEGVPFHMVRIDIAGNISKHFSASGLRFARFSGACPRWNVFTAFLTPGMLRTQLSQMPDGTTYFWLARTVRKEGGGYHAPRTVHALALGCEVAHAKKLVYADGVDLSSREAVVPVGLTCRLCERIDCEQRAFPPLQHPLKVNENVRGVSFYAPVPER